MVAGCGTFAVALLRADADRAADDSRATIRCFDLARPGPQEAPLPVQTPRTRRAICSMSVASDGSLYLNPRRTESHPLVQGKGLADGAGGWEELEWGDPDGPAVQSRKVSYHASGRVKGGGKMSTSVSVRDVERLTLIQQDDYAHPSRFEIIEPTTMRATDIVVPGQDGQ
jgi:hypothetical protein